MNAHPGFAGGDSNPGGKDRQRDFAIALAGVVSALGLLLTLFITQGWLPLDTLLGASASGTSPSETPTATVPPAPTTAPTPPPISSPTFSLPWPTYMGAADRTGFTASETTLTPASAAHLNLRWKRHVGGAIFAQPVVANGLVYWGSWDGYEHATSIATGRDVWTRYLGQTVDGQCEPPAAGISSTATVAIAPVDGRRTPVLYVGGGNAVFYALNAQTGAIVWQTRLGPSPNAYIWSSSAYYNGSIYIGTASFGDCPLIQSRIFMLGAVNGKVARFFNVVPDGCTGGGVWGSVAIDPATGMLYAASGNPGACGVFEPYAQAVIALRASDLAPLGSWLVPPDQQIIDSDFGSTPTLFTAMIGGATRKLVGIANKSGIYYAFDAAHISRGPVWSTRVADIGYCAECGDGSYVPSAWDGKALYVPGGPTTINGVACPAGLRALDPASGHMLWGRCLPGPTYGALTAVPGLLIMGAGPSALVIGAQGATAGRTLFAFHDPQAPIPWFYSSASVADGAVYIGDASGNFYALGL
jgi:outer membrane protein assembly factor BamB